MNPAIFNRPTTDVRLNCTMLQAMASMWDANPENILRNTPDLQITPADVTTVFLPSSVRPEAVIVASDFANLILLSGTQGTLHVDQLIAGWNNPEGSQFNSGANPAFENAALDILGTYGVDRLGDTTHTRIFGYSYGGAVAEVMAEYLINQRGFAQVECVSYGAPRPGNQRFQTRMRSVPNVRFFCDDDPVRFMPPHLDEAPSILQFAGLRLWHGMDTQVQPPTGYEIQEGGNIVCTEGNPTRLHAVIASIARWVADLEGFRSVNHASHRYLNRLLQNLQSNFVFPAKVRNPEVEKPLSVSPREERVYMGQAMADIAADPQINLQPGSEIPLQVVAGTSRDRYKRRKSGSIWTVQFKGEVVAVGPGKRRAGVIARRLNKATVNVR